MTVSSIGSTSKTFFAHQAASGSPVRDMNAPSFAQSLRAESATRDNSNTALEESDASGIASGGLLDQPLTRENSIHYRLIGRMPAYFGEPIRLEDVRTHAENTLKSFHKQFQQELEKAGIALEQEVSLKIRPGDGKVVVAGNYPQATEIEALMASNRKLEDAFRHTHQLNWFVNRFEGAAEFAREYAKDPHQAVAQYSHLFDATDPEFQITITPLDAEFLELQYS